MTKMTTSPAPDIDLSHSPSRPRGMVACALFSVVLLAGCVNYQSVQPGMTIEQAVQKLGKPTTTCKREDGTQRLIWTMQPYGQYAWGTNTTPQGTIVGLQQLLTDANFQKLATGRWTAEQVLCEYGEPANKYGIAKGNEIVWAYRYKESDTWAAMMYVYMGPQGNLANRFHPGPDPLTLNDSDRAR
ncbi:hypothetical protein [Zwartia vadi]|uniref:hypothetical protein n=1 Tax=Zwartia vadi TaxID=3058168 RepID=UPI0025B28E4A|nr:hypothetical protein [Zwartia vadi]MDN3987005.1 hypothetical protein [Zwartia vadi]